MAVTLQLVGAKTEAILIMLLVVYLSSILFFFTSDTNLRLRIPFIYLLFLFSYLNIFFIHLLFNVTIS